MGGLANGGTVPHACPRCGGAGAVVDVVRWRCGACGWVAPVCLYWGLGASPGEPVDAEDLLALEVFGQQRDLGADLVMQLRTLALTQDESERLLQRLHWLTRYVNQPPQPAEA